MGTILLIVLILLLIVHCQHGHIAADGILPKWRLGLDSSHLAHVASHGPSLGSGLAFSHTERVTDWRMHELGTGKR